MLTVYTHARQADPGDGAHSAEIRASPHYAINLKVIKRENVLGWM
jgi:hypothetical protein